MTSHRPGGVSRSVRVTEQVHHELAELVRAEVKDPRVGMVTITGAELTPDYPYEPLYFNVLPHDEDTLASTPDGPRHAAGAPDPVAVTGPTVMLIEKSRFIAPTTRVVELPPMPRNEDSHPTGLCESPPPALARIRSSSPTWARASARPSR